MIYLLSMIVIGIGAQFFVVASFVNSVAGGIITLVVVAPLISLLYLVPGCALGSIGISTMTLPSETVGSHRHHGIPAAIRPEASV